MVLLVIFSKIKYTFWQKLATPIFFVSLLLLILVLIPSFAPRTLGARRWLILGPVSIQPSEIIKFSLALYFAKLSASNKKILSYLIALAAVALLVMLQPDLGTTLIIVAIGMAQMFISNVNLLYFALSLIAGGLASILLVMISGYRRARFMTFLEQTNDPLGKSYHIRQILLSLGSGGLFGVGLGASRQKYLYLPESATDSIFAVIAEEIGFIGAAVMVIAFAYFVFRGIRISLGSPDVFSKVLSFGIVVWIASQIVLNLGSITALTPLTGVPLPLISYGGSSLMMILASIGILLNISKYETKKQLHKRN
jgi:cell division protein FtsW